MTPQARAALGNLEDNEKDYRPPRRTFEEALQYAIEQGYRWGVWDGRYYRIIDGQAVFAEFQPAADPVPSPVRALKAILTALADDEGNLPDNGEYCGAALADMARAAIALAGGRQP